MYLIFDIETTGLIKCEKFNVYPDFSDNASYDHARMVQISWVVLDKKFRIILNKTYTIKRDNFNITNDIFHGITNHKSDVYGVNFNIVMLDFYESLKRTKMLVAHNILFDYNVMLNHLHRYALTNIFMEFSNKQLFCTSYESTNLLKLPMLFPCNYYKYPSLQELYTFYFDKKIKNAHDAKADVKACMDCFIHLMRDLTKVPIVVEIVVVEVEVVI